MDEKPNEKTWEAKLKEAARAYALQNAVQFKGKAGVGAVVGMLMAAIPELKANPADAAKAAKQTVEEINALSIDEQKRLAEELSSSGSEFVKKESKKEKDLFSGFTALEAKAGQDELHDEDSRDSSGDSRTVAKRVVTTFPPEPSKYPHIGHAKAMFINLEFARRHNGRFILRFEDTNPELAKEEYYRVHLEDYKWLGAEFDEVAYASAHMDDFYRLAEKFIRHGHAYACMCKPEQIKENRFKMLECGCRGNTEHRNIELWQQMFMPDVAHAESMILRLKADMQSLNSTLRDPTLFRIIDAPHARTGTKYRVWPSYDFETAVMDGIQGITHRFRSKEFEMRGELQHIIQQLAGFQLTQTYEFARFNLEGVPSSGREIRHLIESGKLIGWDDPALTTIAALRRRGFMPLAIKEFVLGTGISKAEATLTWDDIIVQNRRLLSKECRRYFFVKDPVEIKIKNAPSLNVRIRKHPERPEFGNRELHATDTFYISKDDYDMITQMTIQNTQDTMHALHADKTLDKNGQKNEEKEGQKNNKKNEKKNLNNGIFRMMECLNFSYNGKEFTYHSAEVDAYKKNGIAIIHWLPKTNKLIKAEVLMVDKMQDKTVVHGLAEPAVAELNVDEVIQFERFGFARLDAVNSAMKFWFTHK